MVICERLTCHRQHLQRSHDAQMLKSKIPKLRTPSQEQSAQRDHRGDVTHANVGDVYTSERGRRLKRNVWYHKSGCERIKYKNNGQALRKFTVRRTVCRLRTQSSWLNYGSSSTRTTFWHFMTHMSQSLRNVAWARREYLNTYLC